MPTSLFVFTRVAITNKYETVILNRERERLVYTGTQIILYLFLITTHYNLVVVVDGPFDRDTDLYSIER
jgi:hypothetical protein